MVAAELLGGITAFKSIYDATKSLKDMSDASIRNSAVIDLQAKILDAQARMGALIDECKDLESQVQTLQDRLNALDPPPDYSGTGSAGSAGAGSAGSPNSGAAANHRKSGGTKKTPGSATPAKKPSVKKAASGTLSPKKSAAKKSAAKKSPAKKAAGKKAVAKKTRKPPVSKKTRKPAVKKKPTKGKRPAARKGGAAIKKTKKRKSKA